LTFLEFFGILTCSRLWPTVSDNRINRLLTRV
jgi:hypothetical protein